MASFNVSVDITLKNEGGYVNDPLDPGGETKYGISRKAYPHADIENLTVDQAKIIYLHDYWNPLYNKLDQSIANKLFDAGVNMGVETAVKVFQGSIDLQPDGKFGPETLAKALAGSAVAILPEFTARLCLHYFDIVLEHPTSHKFLLGWLQRVCR
ncbi:MAG: glycoside hydrolase family 108 protein [Terriglobia bacterium]